MCAGRLLVMQKKIMQEGVAGWLIGYGWLQG